MYYVFGSYQQKLAFFSPVCTCGPWILTVKEDWEYMSISVTQYVVYICTYIPSCMPMTYLTYIEYMPNLVGWFVIGTYLEITCEVYIAVDCVWHMYAKCCVYILIQWYVHTNNMYIYYMFRSHMISYSYMSLDLWDSVQ